MRKLLVLLFLLFCSQPVFASGKLVITGALCIDGPVITLADLARAEGQDAVDALTSIAHEPLLASPKFEGARATLHGPKLRELIVQRFGTALPPISVPDRVQVQRGGQVVDTQSLRPAIDKILTTALESYEGEVEFREYRLADYFFLNSKEAVQFRVSPVGTLGPGRISLRLEAVNEEGVTLQSFTGTVFADVWKTVPCAGRVLNRGDILEPGLVTFARKNLAYLSRPPWDGQGLPLRMAGPVGEGQPITMDAVEIIPLITKGQVVTMVYAGDMLTLTVPAESLEDGGAGSRIRVRNVQSKKTVIARIIDDQTVQVP